MNTNERGCVLGIALATNGFGFALFESVEPLVDWGFKRIREDKNNGCLKVIEEMIAHCSPDVIVLRDFAGKNSRRPARMRNLGRGIVALAESQSVDVLQLTREQINKAFFPDGTGTKYSVAESLAKLFPDELARQLPPKRKAWMSEDYRMEIFDAVALCLASRAGKSQAEAARQGNSMQMTGS